MNTLTGILVGMHFRPPAKLILECLPAGAELQLVAEPENAYDAFAVQVYVRLGSVAASQRKRLEEELPGFGWTMEDFDQRAELGEGFQLGFLTSAKNKVFKQAPDCVSNEVFLEAQHLVPWSECQIKLGFHASGLPVVVMKA